MLFFDIDDAHDERLRIALVACDFQAVMLCMPVDAGEERDGVVGGRLQNVDALFNG